MNFRQRQGDILGLDPDRSTAAYPVAGDDPVTAAGGRNLIDGRLQFCPQRIGAFVQAAFQELNAEGVTIVLVTHEDEVARYAWRIVELRDGRVVRDEPVQRPQQAAADLEQWEEAA